MKKMTLLLCIALPSLAMSQVATTRINTLTMRGHTTQTSAVAYRLPTQWRQSDLMKAIRHYQILPLAETFTVYETVETVSGTRINLTAAYRARPVFDKELILTVAKTGEITHIDNRMVESPEFVESQFSEAQLKSIVQNDLLTQMHLLYFLNMNHLLLYKDKH